MQILGIHTDNRGNPPEHLRSVRHTGEICESDGIISSLVWMKALDMIALHKLCSRLVREGSADRVVLVRAGFVQKLQLIAHGRGDRASTGKYLYYIYAIWGKLELAQLARAKRARGFQSQQLACATNEILRSNTAYIDKSRHILNRYRICTPHLLAWMCA